MGDGNSSALLVVADDLAPGTLGLSGLRRARVSIRDDSDLDLASGGTHLKACGVEAPSEFSRVYVTDGKRGHEDPRS